MEREKLRREAEEARRTQQPVVVDTVEVEAASFLPPPRKVGKPSSSADKNLQKKLLDCFGQFEKVYPHYVAKDETHSRIVGVIGYPPTPTVGDPGSSSLSFPTESKAGSSTTPSVDDIVTVVAPGDIKIDDIRKVATKKHSKIVEQRPQSSSSATANTVKDKDKQHQSNACAASSNSSLANGQLLNSITTATNGHKSESVKNGYLLIKEKNKEKATLDISSSITCNNSNAAGSAATVSRSGKPSSSSHHDAKTSRDNAILSGNKASSSEKDKAQHHYYQSSSRKDSDSSKKREDAHRNSGSAGAHSKSSESVNNDRRRSRNRSRERSTSTSRTVAAISGVGVASCSQNSGVVTANHNDIIVKQRSSEDNKKSKDPAKQRSNDLLIANGASKKSTQQHHKERPTLSLSRKADEKHINEDCIELSSDAHRLSSSSPSRANSLIRKIKDIVPPPLSGIIGTPSSTEQRPVFNFSENSHKNDRVDLHTSSVFVKRELSAGGGEKFKNSGVIDSLAGCVSPKAVAAKDNGDNDGENTDDNKTCDAQQNISGVIKSSRLTDDLRLSDDDEEEPTEEKVTVDTKSSVSASCKQNDSVGDKLNVKTEKTLTCPNGAAGVVEGLDIKEKKPNVKSEPSATTASLPVSLTDSDDEQENKHRNLIQIKKSSSSMEMSKTSKDRNLHASGAATTVSERLPSYDLKSLERYFDCSTDQPSTSRIDADEPASTKHSSDKRNKSSTSVANGVQKKASGVQHKSQENDALVCYPGTSSASDAVVDKSILSRDRITVKRSLFGTDDDESDDKATNNSSIKLKISKKNSVKSTSTNDRDKVGQQPSSALIRQSADARLKNVDERKKKDGKAQSSSATAVVVDDSVDCVDEDNRKRKKLKTSLDKMSTRNVNDIVSVNSKNSHQIVNAAEQASSASNDGFVETGSPGKENYSINGSSEDVVEGVDNHHPLLPTDNDDVVVSNHKVGINAKKKQFTMAKNAETILRESCRLSPLLSPIHEFPPFEYRNGVPSLMCRLPLNLLTRLPPEANGKLLANSQISVASQQRRRKDGVDQNIVDSGTKTLNDNGDNCDSDDNNNNRTVTNGDDGSVNDWDDMPITERMPKEKKKGPLAATKKVSASEKKVDVERDVVAQLSIPATSVNASVAKATSPINAAANLVCGSAPADASSLSASSNCCKTGSSLEKTIDSVVLSNLSTTYDEKDKEIRKKNVSGSKRKSSVDDATKVDVSLPKKPKIDNTSLMSCAPEKPFDIDCTVKEPKFYMDKAKEIKHRADAQGMDRSMRLILYLESIIYFFLTGYAMEKTLNKQSARPFAMMKDTHELLKSVTQKYISQVNELSESAQVMFAHKVEVMSLRLQALLCLQMYNVKHSSILANYRHINEYQKSAKDRPNSVHGALSTTSSANESQTTPSRLVNNEEKLPSLSSGDNANASSSSRPNASSTPSPTPSPASSTGSSSHSLPPGLVAIPQQVENLYKQQLNYLHNLFMAHHNWQSADARLKPHDLAFFNHLDSICHPISLNSMVPSICVYLLTATDWLKRVPSR